MRFIGKELAYATPEDASSAYEYTYYGRAEGRDKVRLRFLDISNDIFDHGSLAFSTDNGATWPDERPHLASRKTSDGTLRQFDGLGWVDPANRRLLTLYLEGLFREDNLLEGMSQYYLMYRVSEDGGRTSIADERVIQSGGGFSPEHPIESVWIGKNCMCIPSIPPIVRTQSGHLVMCISISIVGDEGRPTNPGGGLTWLEEQILIGRWREDGRIDWECGQRLTLPPTRSTRGLDEMTLTEMPDGRLLLVMRGSNDPEGRIPGHKWHSVSSDGGATWTEPQPWGYSDGALFHSPASMCQIVRHSNGRYYWFGNICDRNPLANLPRYPLVAGQIDADTLALMRETVSVVDTREPDEPENVQLSNFFVHEDRADGMFILEMPRFMPQGDKWIGDTYRYRLQP